MNNSGIFNKYNFNVSGANSKFSYRTNISYLNIDEPQLGNTTKQLNAGINLGYRQDKWDINLSLNPSYIQQSMHQIFIILLPIFLLFHLIMQMVLIP